MSGDTTDLAAIQSRAADFLLDRHEGDWSAAKQAELDVWLKESLAHRIAYWRLDAAWDRADLLGAIRRAPLERVRVVPKPSVWPGLSRLAAAVALVAGLGFFVVPELTRAPDKTYTTAVGEREKLTLADGSQIELNTDTVLRTLIAADRREIWLEKGEVYFEVKNGDRMPFIVMVDGHRITDIGTKFTVRRQNGHFQVAVLEGRVQIDAPDARAGWRLGSGEVAVASNGRISVSKKSREDLDREMGWQRGVLIFDRMSLAEAAAEFNRYNRTQLVIAPSAAAVTLDGTFPSNNVEAFTRLARSVLGLKVETRGHEILISK